MRVGCSVRIPHLHFCMLNLKPTGHDCLDHMPFDGRWVVTNGVDVDRFLSNAHRCNPL